MFRVRSIESLDLPPLAPYLTLRQRSDHYVERLFVAEGPKVVERLLSSDLTTISALLTPEGFESLRERFQARSETIEVFLGPKALLSTMIGFPLYQGVLACARIPGPAELDVVLSLAARPRFLVAIDGLANAENMGAVVRTAAAFGAQGLIIGETCVHPYLRRAVRASMGNIFQLPVVEPVRLTEALGELRRRGIRCLGAHPHTDRRFLPDAVFTGDCCLVLGSEGDGLSDGVRAVCDELIAVPMRGGVDSLNVSAAAAVFCYEVWRQRRTSRVEGRES